MTKKELYNLKAGHPLFSWSAAIAVKFEGWVIGEDNGGMLALYGQQFAYPKGELFRCSQNYAMSTYEVTAEKALHKLNKFVLDGYKKHLQELIKHED